jgi:HEAT repeat protein
MGICAVAFSSYRQGFNTVEQIGEYATYLKEASKSRREKDNIFLTPKDLNILNVPVKEFVMNNAIPLFKRRTVIEAMGESGLIHYGRILLSLLDEDIHSLLKKSVIFALGRLRFTPAQEIIIKYASDSNPHLRTRAVEALGQIGGAKYLQKIGQMVTDSNPYVAVMAVKSLGIVGHPEGLKYLKNIPLNSSRWLSLESAITRASLGDKTVLGELKKLIKDPNPLNRKRISTALEMFSSVESIEILLNAIESEKMPRIRNTFIISLGRIIKSISYNKLKIYSSRLWKIYKSAPEDIKPFLFPAIAKCRIKGANKILERKSSSSNNLERFFAIEGMVYFNNPGHVYLIRKSLKDNSTQVRARSASAIGEIMDIEGMEFLRRSLKDTDEHVRKKASESILKMAMDVEQDKK